jgi:hypothetical protein
MESTSLTCRNCSQPFNLDDRKPVLLTCGDILCDLCYDACIIQPDCRRLKCPFEQDKLLVAKVDRRFRTYDEAGIMARLRMPKDGGNVGKLETLPVKCELHRESSANYLDW